MLHIFRLTVMIYSFDTIADLHHTLQSFVGYFTVKVPDVVDPVLHVARHQTHSAGSVVCCSFFGWFDPIVTVSMPGQSKAVLLATLQSFYIK